MRAGAQGRAAALGTMLCSCNLRSCAADLPFPPRVQTTDWVGAIQRCFQWSERVEQKAMPKQLQPAHVEAELVKS